MAIKATQAFDNLTLESGYDTAFNNGTLEARSGPQPSSASAIPTGTLLWTEALPADWMSGASVGVKNKAGTWSATAGANGVAGWFRFKQSTDTGIFSEAQVRLDGSIGLAGSGADMIVNDVNFVSGQLFEVLTAQLKRI